MLLCSDLVKKATERDSLTDDNITILDNATGTGAIPSLLLQLLGKGRIPACNVIAADKDIKYIEQLKNRKEVAGSAWDRVEIQQFDMEAPPFSDNMFNFVFSNVGVFFADDDMKVLQETLRILRPGGQAGYSSWKTIAWWPMIQSAHASGIPDAPPLPGDSFLFPKGYNDPEKVRQKLEETGYVDIHSTFFEYQVDMTAESLAETTGPLVNMVLPKLWSREDVEKFAGPKVEKAILTYLQQNYQDGKWDGKMNGIVTFGKKIAGKRV